MPREKSSTSDPLADLDLSQSDETPQEAPPVEPAVAGKVKLAFDPAAGIGADAGEVSVSVAASGIHKFKTDGTPVEVSAEVAELLVQSPAVKEVK